MKGQNTNDTMRNTAVKDIKKPHFVSEARIFRQYERGVLVTNCHILFPLGNDSTKLNHFFEFENIFSKENHRIILYITDIQLNNNLN